jgi:hypothetical protein
MQPVHSDLEAALGQLADESRVDPVPGAEIEGRTEPVCLLQIGQLEDKRQAFGALDVVGEDERRSIRSRPEPPNSASRSPRADRSE